MQRRYGEEKQWIRNRYHYWIIYISYFSVLSIKYSYLMRFKKATNKLMYSFLSTIPPYILISKYWTEIQWLSNELLHLSLVTLSINSINKKNRDWIKPLNFKVLWPKSQKCGMALRNLKIYVYPLSNDLKDLKAFNIILKY